MLWLTALVATALVHPPLPVARANDNAVPAGMTVAGTRRIRLVVQRSRWFPDADDGPSIETEAVGEEGKLPTIPAPIIRVLAATRVDATIRNALPDTIAFFAQCGVECRDTLLLAPGATIAMPVRTDRPGTYGYGAFLIRRGKPYFDTGAATETSGAIVIDSVGAPRDRVLVIGAWIQRFDTTKAGDDERLVMTINGRMWPHTERFKFAVGDTVRWRVLDVSGDTHPMHLHGFYFRVDSRGDGNADTAYSAAQRRWAVTEATIPLGSFSLTWVPQRAGNWIFHCHKAPHMMGYQHDDLAGKRFDENPFEDASLLHDAHDAHEMSDADHIATGMGGLVIGIEVTPRAISGTSAPAIAASAPPATEPRHLRLFAQRRPGRDYSTLGYVLQHGDAVPAADSVEVPGPTLVLTRDQPVEISVINRLPVRTGVHWHGIELDSYYDGVGGWSGAGQRLAPRVAPNDSFVVRFTPPRAGTFMYHSHTDEVRQIALGLYGALVVLEPGAKWDPSTDHVVMIGNIMVDGDPLLGVNGRANGRNMRIAAGKTHRFRLLNVTIDNDAEVVLLTDASAPVLWRPVAKDGADLPVSARAQREAKVTIGPGETLDVEASLAPGRYQLRVRSNIGNVLRTVVVQ